MQRDIQLYQEYAQILIDNVPCDFKKITSDCILSAKNAFVPVRGTVTDLSSWSSGDCLFRGQPRN